MVEASFRAVQQLARDLKLFWLNWHRVVLVKEGHATRVPRNCLHRGSVSIGFEEVISIWQFSNQQFKSEEQDVFDAAEYNWAPSNHRQALIVVVVR